MPLMTLPEAEKRQILAALQATNWRIYGPRGAARLLGIGPEKLRYRMRKYGLKRPNATFINASPVAWTITGAVLQHRFQSLPRRLTPD